MNSIAPQKINRKELMSSLKQIFPDKKNKQLKFALNQNHHNFQNTLKFLQQASNFPIGTHQNIKSKKKSTKFQLPKSKQFKQNLKFIRQLFPDLPIDILVQILQNYPSIDQATDFLLNTVQDDFDQQQNQTPWEQQKILIESDPLGLLKSIYPKIEQQKLEQTYQLNSSDLLRSVQSIDSQNNPQQETKGCPDQIILQTLYERFPQMPPEVIQDIFVQLNQNPELTQITLQQLFQLQGQHDLILPPPISDFEFEEKMKQMEDLKHKNLWVKKNAATLAAAGNKVQAKNLRTHAKQMMNASKAIYQEIYLHIFSRKNPRFEDFNRLDLHSLRVKDALQIVKKVVGKAMFERKGRLEIVTGRGNHSRGGVAKIRPAVFHYLKSLGLDFKETQGSFVLNFS